MCPDTNLLAASVDGTLFPGDIPAIERHVTSCLRCAEIVARFGREREVAVAERTGTESRGRSGGSALAGVFTLVAIGGSLTLYGLGAVSGSEAETAPPSERPAPVHLASAVAGPALAATLAARTPDVRRSMKAVPRRIASLANAHVDVRTVPENVTAAAARVTDPVTATASEGTKAPAAVATVTGESREITASAHLDIAHSAPDTAVALPAESSNTEAGSPAGFILRGKDRKPAWRARSGVIARSADGGTTWTEEYKVDRPIVAGAFVTPEVAWLATADGAILRRTAVGWFETSARADGAVASIRASSSTKASVTLVDGRTFETKNAGVEWTEGPASAAFVKDSDKANAASKNGATTSRRRSRRGHR